MMRNCIAIKMIPHTTSGAHIKPGSTVAAAIAADTGKLTSAIIEAFLSRRYESHFFE
jgi:hypothetical protein